MKFEIVIGSVLGASEYVAEACAALLKENGHDAICHFTPDIRDIDLTQPILVVTSTHGAGELPDNIQAFAKDLSTKKDTRIRALVIGLGDSSYDTFCEGSRTIAKLIEGSGGMLCAPVYQIDVLHHPIPEDVAVDWLSKHLHLFA